MYIAQCIGYRGIGGSSYYMEQREESDIEAPEKHNVKKAGGGFQGRKEASDGEGEREVDAEDSAEEEASQARRALTLPQIQSTLQSIEAVVNILHYIYLYSKLFWNRYVEKEKLHLH